MRQLANDIRELSCAARAIYAFERQHPTVESEIIGEPLESNYPCRISNFDSPCQGGKSVERLGSWQNEDWSFILKADGLFTSYVRC